MRRRSGGGGGRRGAGGSKGILYSHSDVLGKGVIVGGEMLRLGLNGLHRNHH